MEACPPGVCVVCGKPVAPVFNQRYLYKAVACSDIYCKTSLLSEPLLAPPRPYLESERRRNRAFTRPWKHQEAVTTQKRNIRQLYRLIQSTSDIIERADTSLVLVELVKLRFDSAMWYLDNEWLGQDERGVLDEYGREQSVWNTNSRVKIAFKVVGGTPAISMECPLTDQPANVLMREFSQSNSLPDHYDYFFVWRCGCPEAHEVHYKTPQDIPNRYGYHDACEVCWCAPVEVLRPGEKAFK